MRLATEKIKAAILHPDREVRESAIYYFAEAHSFDPEIMPLAIQAFERHGLDAFSTYSFLFELAQTSETVAWLIREIERVGEGTEEREGHYFLALVRALRRSDTDLLIQHFDAIQSMQKLDDFSERVIADRMAVDSLMTDELWTELGQFGEEIDDDEMLEDENDEHGRAIVTRLALDGERSAQHVLHCLEHPAECTGWREVLIARLAGELKLEAAISWLADHFEDLDTWACQEAQWALEKIGSDSVVREVARRYAAGDWDIRVTVACTLGRIQTDFSVQTCLDLLRQEADDFLRGLLLEAILMNFCPWGMEPARQHVLHTPKSPEVLEVRTALLVAAKVLGETFPEFEAWQEDAKHDVEFRRQWYQEHYFPNADDAEFEDGFADTDLADEELFEEEEESPTTIRRGQRVGRNDPCPCGSGKKFKKCCYSKREIVEESDSDHAHTLSAFRSGASPKKYPIGTIALYGPDDRTTTKIVAAVIKRQNAEPILERWVGTTVRNNPKVQRQIKTFFDRHNVKSVVAADGNLGCPHEEGLDFPAGEDCPFCPFWAGQQGSARRE